MSKATVQNNLSKYMLVRVTDGVMVETFATEEEVTKYFMDANSPHQGKNYELKGPQVSCYGVLSVFTR